MGQTHMDEPSRFPLVRYGIVVAVVIVGGLTSLLCIFAVGYFNKWRPNKELAVCASNLKRIEAALRSYAGANNAFPPPVSTHSGELMFSPKAVPVTNAAGQNPLRCPTVRSAGHASAPTNSAPDTPAYDDQSYCYLGYAVLDDDDVEVFAKAYRKQRAAGKPFDEDLVVGEGSDARVLHRLSERVDEVWRATGDPNAVSPYEGH